MNLIEGQHWLFNRYAFLGILPDAPEADIKAAIKRIRVENHPDTVRQRSADIQKLAERATRDAAACEAVLLNPTKRAAFDMLLKDFQATKPRLINTVNVPILTMETALFDTAVLLGGHGNAADDMLAQAKAMTGYDPVKLEALKALAHQQSDNATIQQLYAEALQNANVYLGLAEEHAWLQAGVANKQSSVGSAWNHPEDYLKLVKAEVERVKAEDLPAQLHQLGGVARLGAPLPPLLLAGPAGTANDLAVNPLVVLDAVQATFAARAAKVIEIAEVRQQVILDLLQHVVTRWLTERPTDKTTWDIVLALQADLVWHVHVVLRVLDAEAVLTDSPQAAAWQGLSIAELATQLHTNPVLVVEYNPDLLNEPMVVLTAVVQDHWANLKPLT